MIHFYDFQEVSDEELDSEEYKKQLFEEFKIAYNNTHSAKPIEIKDIEELISEEKELREI